MPLISGKNKLIRGLVFLFGQQKVRRGCAAVLFFMLLTFFITVESVPQRVRLQVGEVSPTNIFAPHRVIYEDVEETERLRREAVESVGDQYDHDARIKEEVEKEISSVFTLIRQVQNEKSLGLQEKVERLRSRLPFTLPDEVLTVLAQPAPQTLSKMEKEVLALVVQEMDSDKGINVQNISQTRKTMTEKFNRLGFNNAYEDLAREIFQSTVRPNAFYNPEKTIWMKKAAEESVRPQQIRIQEGEKIIGAGEVVHPEHIAKLEALGMLNPGVPWRKIAGNAFLVSILMVVVLFYLYQQNREIYRHAGHLYLLGIVVVVVLGIGKALIAIDMVQWPELGAMFGYMVPLATAGMLIAILLDSKLAVLVIAIMSFLVALMTGGQVRFGVVGLIGGIAGVYSVSKLSQRGDMARAGVYTSAAYVAAILVIGLQNNTPMGLMITSSLLGVINGILSSILTIGVLPYLESTFRITSSIRLLELSNPGNPLLRQLLTAAPGTYHHSIIVGNLAESAAEAIGGNGLLVRVGAYYHDIGKIKRPYFFIENIVGGDNPHDKITPSLSALILTSHIKDGVELAKEHGLPKDIINIVEQHHGTTLVTYFYHKAIEAGSGENMNEEDFRYEGPKPKSREAAVVMLADTVEAAVRAMQNHSRGKIEGMVRKILKDKLMDGQFDECDLTFKDLDAIATAFMRVLDGIFHSRVEYPESAVDTERSSKDKSGGNLK